jgi:hypothetical protein
MKINFTLAVFIAALSIISFGQKAEKLKAEDVIAKNLESIGTPENRAKITNRAFFGKVDFFQGAGTTYKSFGEFGIASEGNKRLLGVNFNVENYPVEKISFDGNMMKVGFIQPNVRSGLGEYLRRFDLIVKDGLFWGVLAENWVLNDVSARKAKVKMGGNKKIDGKECYVLEYLASKSNGLEVKLFFDKDTFRHVRSEYKSIIPAPASNNPNTSSTLAETRETLVEDFGDFKTEENLMLPHLHKVDYTISQDSLRQYRYTFVLDKFYVNQKFDSSTFDIDVKK